MKTPLKNPSEHNTFSLSYETLPLKENNFYVGKITSKLAGNKVSIKEGSTACNGGFFNGSKTADFKASSKTLRDF